MVTQAPVPASAPRDLPHGALLASRPGGALPGARRMRASRRGLHEDEGDLDRARASSRASCSAVWPRRPSADPYTPDARDGRALRAPARSPPMPSSPSRCPLPTFLEASAGTPRSLPASGPPTPACAPSPAGRIVFDDDTRSLAAFAERATPPWRAMPRATPHRPDARRADAARRASWRCLTAYVADTRRRRSQAAGDASSRRRTSSRAVSGGPMLARASRAQNGEAFDAVFADRAAR